MNRVIRRRFTRGLFSCFLLLVLFAFGYSPNGIDVPAFAAGDPDPINKSESPKGDLKDASSSPNELNRETEVIRRPVIEASLEKATPPATPPVLRMDSEKGDVTLPAELSLESEIVEFQATAYCLKGRTASGVNTRPGIIAADPRVLPLGTVVHIRAGRYTGMYTVLDTGSRIKGHTVDIFLPDYVEARRFGRQRIKVKVLSRGGRRSNSGLPVSSTIARSL